MTSSDSMDDHLSTRTEYGQEALHDADQPDDPIELLKSWLAHAGKELNTDHNAMVLSTTGEHGPSSRVVLLRGIDNLGLEFFTNYNSRKGKELAAAPRASLHFFWPSLERQIRIEGSVTKSSAERSNEYFGSRPRESQLGTWASDQSERVSDRAALETAYQRAEERFAGGPVPRPEHWGGYLLEPVRIEFWQGRPGRLHDRFQYERKDAAWHRTRLQP